MLHDILKSFPGSQDGRFTEQFVEGTQRDLTPYLAEIAVREGWARPVQVDNKAIVTDGSRPRGRRS